MVKLSGSGHPYSFVQQQYDPATNTWSHMAGGCTGTSNCYKSKGKSGLARKVVRIAWESSAGDWRFQWVEYGASDSAIPANLYLASNYWTGKVPFAYDSASALWVAGVMVTGNVHDQSTGCDAATNISTTAMIYHMNTSGALTR